MHSLLSKKRQNPKGTSASMKKYTGESWIMKYRCNKKRTRRKYPTHKADNEVLHSQLEKLENKIKESEKRHSKFTKEKEIKAATLYNKAFQTFISFSDTKRANEEAHRSATVKGMVMKSQKKVCALEERQSY